MALIAVTNRLMIHAETLSDVESLGSNDGVVADSVAFIQDTSTWLKPQTITPSSTSWTSVPSAFPAGIPEGVRAYVDAGNLACFPDATATDIFDLVRNARSGTLDGVSVVDSHLNFDGTDDFVSFNKNSNLNDVFGSGGTVFVFARPESYTASHTLVSTQGATGADGWQILLNSSGTLVFTHNRDTLGFLMGSDPNVSAGRWHSFAFAGASTGSGSLYLDGVDVTPSVFIPGSGTPANDSGNSLYIGRKEDGTAPFDGDIDLVLVWDRVLSSDEVRQVHDLFRGRLVRGTDAHQLIETITVTAAAGVSSVTFSGLDGDFDYSYRLQARIPPGSLNEFLVRPNGVAFSANEGLGSYYEVIDIGTTAPLYANDSSRTDGWILVSQLNGGDGGTSYVHSSAEMFIQARREVGGAAAGGSASARTVWGQGVVIDYNPGTTSYVRNRATISAGGWYQTTPDKITSLEITASNPIVQGSQFSLYRVLSD